jgi:hypothetical protein
VLLGIVLTSVTIRISGGEVWEVQVRFSINNLVADQFRAQRHSGGAEKTAIALGKIKNDSMSCYSLCC